jgi:hypothetical protein
MARVNNFNIEIGSDLFSYFISTCKCLSYIRNIFTIVILFFRKSQIRLQFIVYNTLTLQFQNIVCTPNIPEVEKISKQGSYWEQMGW